MIVFSPLHIGLCFFKLADLASNAPSPQDIWEYFTCQIVPVIREWQVEARSGASKLPIKMAPVNTFFVQLVEHFKSTGETLNQVN